jgi:hypothetical protein
LAGDQVGPLDEGEVDLDDELGPARRLEEATAA